MRVVKYEIHNEGHQHIAAQHVRTEFAEFTIGFVDQESDQRIGEAVEDTHGCQNIGYQHNSESHNACGVIGDQRHGHDDDIGGCIVHCKKAICQNLARLYWISSRFFVGSI